MSDSQQPIDAECEPQPFRYSLRALLAAVLACCVFFAYPRYVLSVAGLLIAALIVLGIMIFFIFLPIMRTLERISERDEARRKPYD